MASTLASDIINVLRDPAGRDPQVSTPDTWADVAVQIAKHTSRVLKPREDRRREGNVLWASELGEKCHRKLWYKLNTPSVADPISGAAKFKFAYGNVIEEMALVYAKAAGWRVTRQQEVVEETLQNGWKVRGRIDAVVESDSAPTFVLDVKSCSSQAFLKYSKEPVLSPWNDSFGYNAQLQFYDNNLKSSGEVTAPGEFLFIDKQLGSMASISSTYDMFNDYRDVKGSDEFSDAMVSVLPPSRAYGDVADGMSGNRKLAVACSYCDFKRTCWPELRGFLYSTGPRFLTSVVVEPKVPELKPDPVVVAPPETAEEGPPIALPKAA